MSSAICSSRLFLRQSFRLPHRSGGESRVVRFMLSWHAPTWKGAERDRLPLLQSNYAGGAKTEWRLRSGPEKTLYVEICGTYRNALEVTREVVRIIRRCSNEL